MKLNSVNPAGTTDKNIFIGPGYPGNKNVPGLIQKIVNEIPACSTVTELFAGSAGLTRFLMLNNHCHGVTFYINDLDVNLVMKTARELPYSVFSQTDNAFNVLQDLINVKSGDPEKHFIFMDPPYMLHTRANRTYYKHEFTDQDHERFLNLVVQLKCYVMIIHPVCDLYEAKLASFRKVQLKVRYRAKTATECLYMNYAPPEKKLVYSTTGTDCWDRQRIKRKGDRIVKRILALPDQEKQYIIDRIKTEVL